MSERWLPIPGYEGYEVSNLGRVRSLDRTITTKRGVVKRRRGQLLSTYRWGKGKYLTVGLPNAAGHHGSRPHAVHNLVMLAFVGPTPEGMEVRHLDGDSVNAQLANLAYGTPLENAADMRRHGTHHNSLRVTCRYGHRLEAPNLVPARLPRRICLACSRARPTVQQAARRGLTLDHQAISDGKYLAIMGQLVAATTGA